MDILSKFRTGLKKTSSYLASNIIHSLKSKQISSEIINDVETTLISADIGLEVTELLVNRIKSIKLKSNSPFVGAELAIKAKLAGYNLSLNYNLWGTYNVFLDVINIFGKKYNTALLYSQMDRSFNFGIKRRY